MARITTTFTVSMPPDMAEQIELVRRREHRTRSELVREALRVYVKTHSITQRDTTVPHVVNDGRGLE